MGASSDPTTDAVEALWQHMHQEPADEFVGSERHHPLSLLTFEAAFFHLKVTPWSSSATRLRLEMATLWV